MPSISRPIRAVCWWKVMKASPWPGSLCREIRPLPHVVSEGAIPTDFDPELYPNRIRPQPRKGCTDRLVGLVPTPGPRRDAAMRLA